VQSVDKKYFVFNKGINTEAPLVAWPEGFTVDEQNFDLLQDGSRRRRLGLSYEAGGNLSNLTCEGASTDLSSGTKFYRWKNVNNSDENNFIVAQTGSSLYVWADPISGPIGDWLYEFPLLDYRVHTEDYAPSDSDIASMTCSFSEAEGKLIVVGPHIEPTAITLEDGILVGETITVLERDLFGVEDGVSLEVTPETLSDTHRYNLYNRGWEIEKIDEVFTDKGLYPAKNMLQYMGMRTLTESGYSDNDGVKLFSPEKLMEEIFQNMSAPQGHITRNVFDRSKGFGSLGQGTNLKTIESVDSVQENTGEITVTVTETDSEVAVNDDVEIRGMVLKFRGPKSDKKIDISGVYPVTAVNDTNTFTFTIPTDIYAQYPRYIKCPEKGQYTVNGIIEADFEGFEPATTRFAVTAAFSGRVFYGACPDSRLTDRIYFTKSIETSKDFGYCYQEADPTSEFIADLIATDGGYITIPNLGTLRSLVPYGRALLCFSSEGVWAIGPGEGGVFSALGYSVQKVTDAGCVAKQSIVVADNIPLYWSSSGIYAIMEDRNSGFLSAQNMTQASINGLFHAIRYQEKTRVKAAYDSVRKRAIFLYNSRLTLPASGDAPITGEADLYSTSVTPMGSIDDTDTPTITYDTALIFDLRLQAWIKWVFADNAIPVRDVYTLPTGYSNDDLNQVIRFWCQEEGSTRHYIGQLTNTEYLDWGSEAPAFIFTGPDSLGEPERFKYAPYVHVFMRKESKVPVVVGQTPLPFTYLGEGAAVDLILSGRASSLFMQPRWDWARGLDSGKITSYTQVYREIKTHPDSFGMVVTKNKVRGRGRSLFLCFKAGPSAPAWLDGWTIKYDAQPRI
jgi:hypothetical protein